MRKMFFRHLLAMLIVLIGIVAGILLDVLVYWKTGVVVGIVVCFLGIVFAVINLFSGVSRVAKSVCDDDLPPRHYGRR